MPGLTISYSMFRSSLGVRGSGALDSVIGTEVGMEGVNVGTTATVGVGVTCGCGSGDEHARIEAKRAPTKMKSLFWLLMRLPSEEGSGVHRMTGNQYLDRINRIHSAKRLSLPANAEVLRIAPALAC